MISRVLFAAGILFFLLLFPLQALTNDDGAPSSNTGAPGNDTCAAGGCHEDQLPNSGPGTVSISTPDTYAPGATMNFTVRVEQTNQSRFGFQATARPVNDPFRFTGTFQLGQGTLFADAVQRYITHDEAPTSNGSYEWDFQWTAPMEDVGPIRLYVAGVAGNGNGRNTGDMVYTDSLTIATSVAVEKEALPAAFTLEQAYPNPFQTQTTIGYTMQRSEPVQVSLYDVLGRRVKALDEGTRATGAHEILVDASDLPAGTYFYEIQTPTTRKTGTVSRVE